MSGLDQLADELREEGGLLAAALGDASAEDPLLADTAAPAPYALVLAAVREGYRLHYGEGAVVRTGDPDLALLGGDRLYALALARLAALGDLPAVAALADLISACAQAHAEGDAPHAESAWIAAITAIGQGS